LEFSKLLRPFLEHLYDAGTQRDQAGNRKLKRPHATLTEDTQLQY
jgi:hypothetical protein